MDSSLHETLSLKISNSYLTFLNHDGTMDNECIHSHKKRKNSLEIQTILLIFLLELKIAVVAVQGIHQNSNNGFLQ